MARSIMPGNVKGKCYICKAHCTTETHHIFEGANRPASEKYGLTVEICRVCHRRAHEHPKEFEEMHQLKAKAQKIAMEHYRWTVEQFRKLFRKSYI